MRHARSARRASTLAALLAAPALLGASVAGCGSSSGGDAPGDGGLDARESGGDDRTMPGADGGRDARTDTGHAGDAKTSRDGAANEGGDGGAAAWDPPFPRLGSYCIGSPQNYGDPAFISAAAKEQVVIVSNYQGFSNAGMTMSDVFAAIKAASKVGTKLFSYVNNNETESYTESAILDQVMARSWFLYPSGMTGTPVPSSWPGATEVNNTTFTKPDGTGKNWIQWYDDFRYAAFVTGDGMDTPNPNGDGFFMDNVFWSPRVNGDWNLDGTTDSDSDPTVQGWYRAGYEAHFDYVRTIWPGSLQLGNVADWGATDATLGVYDQLLDGGVLEGYFGDSWSYETYGGFAVMMAAYKKTMDALAPPKLGVVGDDQGATDYQGMRYGLGSTLMDDAFYYHSTAGSYAPPPLWYDEFDSDLGHPSATPLGARQTAAWQNGVWRRDFDDGIALVNPKGNGAQTVDLGGTFTKLLGTQDPSVNDGSKVTQVTLADRDGLILER